VIGQPVKGRISLLARVDRIVSTIVAVAFLITGFQTGYRLTHGAGSVFPSIEWSPVSETPSPAAAPVETPVSVQATLPSWLGAERFNVLLMGLDQRAGSALPGRADVIMIANVDPETLGVSLLSIPRDLWVEIPGHGENRINSAYFYGEFDGAEGGGPGLMKRTVELNFGIDIDYFGTLDFECFKQIIDILGGITVHVPEEIRDDQYPDDSYGYTRIYIPAGRQQMDGETALQYVRARHQSSDFSRMRRQQQVLLAVREKALRLDIIFSLPELIPLLGKAFSTDLPTERLLALANLGAQVKLEDIGLNVIDESLTIPYVAPDGAQVLLPRVDQVQALVGELFEDAPVVVESHEMGTLDAQVLVRADVARPGLATEVADLLQRRGYVARAADDGVQIESEGTFIASRRDMAETAVLIAGLLRVAPEFVMLESSVEGDTDIVITLGRDFVMPE
jgi:LCP family protein required for cell wall assembly